MSRAYLDWNATAPLRLEARAAMVSAMDVLGNPSSVHAEGRAARAIIERARAQIAEAFGAASADIVFTSGATEAAMLGLQGRDLHGAGIEHDCVQAWIETDLECDRNGVITLDSPETATLQGANGETGVVQDLPEGLALSDCVQLFGKLPFGFDWSGIRAAILSAHKIGGPAGVGALVLRPGQEITARLKGGGQEMGRRAGTENLVGIAGFGAAAEAAARDLKDGLPERLAELRDALEERLLNEANDLIVFGKGARRLPNTSAFAVPGWKGETQVMQMDLAGYAVSAGSACSSGKVRPSSVLRAMGHDDITAASAIRVSIGASTTRDDLAGFADAWRTQYKRIKAKAA